ncbi:hypothetical protein OAO18_00015 [Francisellaceae bacterium]|nr:hypothetical protein [Francisellaceae bacterium]
MSMFKVNSCFDKIDPYWYTRLLSIKTVYITVIFFMVNLFFELPSPPTLYMVVGIIGPLLAEMPSLNTQKQKDSVILLFVVLAIFSLSVFAMIWYIKTWFILVAFSWAYILYTALKKKPALFSVVSLIFLMGVMSLESPIKPASLNNMFNEIIYYFQFATIGFWAHKFFPNLYFRCWHSMMLRCIEAHMRSIKNNQVEFETYSRHLLAAQNVLPLLQSKPYAEQLNQFTQKMLELNYITDSYIRHNISSSEFSQYKANVTQLYESIKSLKDYLSINTLSENNLKVKHTIQDLFSSWKVICTKNC